MSAPLRFVVAGGRVLDTKTGDVHWRSSWTTPAHVRRYAAARNRRLGLRAPRTYRFCGDCQSAPCCCPPRRPAPGERVEDYF
jgi:hypothetical protein